MTGPMAGRRFQRGAPGCKGPSGTGLRHPRAPGPNPGRGRPVKAGIEWRRTAPPIWVVPRSFTAFVPDQGRRLNLF